VPDTSTAVTTLLPAWRQGERKARVVELRFFGGLTNAEIALALGVGSDTVTRDWQMAKLWLWRELQRERPRGH